MRPRRSGSSQGCHSGCAFGSYSRRISGAAASFLMSFGAFGSPDRLLLGRAAEEGFEPVLPVFLVPLAVLFFDFWGFLSIIFLMVFFLIMDIFPRIFCGLRLYFILY